MADAPDWPGPIDAAAAGLEAAGEQVFVQERRDFSRQRQAVIASNLELQERELALAKLAALSTAIADALQRRGQDDPAAALIAEVAIAVFRTAFERWINPTTIRTSPNSSANRSTS